MGSCLICLFSIKYEAANDRGIEMRKIKGAHIKRLKGATGKFPESQWASTFLVLSTSTYNLSELGATPGTT